MTSIFSNQRFYGMDAKKMIEHFKHEQLVRVLHDSVEGRDVVDLKPVWLCWYCNDFSDNDSMCSVCGANLEGER